MVRARLLALATALVLLATGCSQPDDDSAPDEPIEVWAVGDGPGVRPEARAVAAMIAKAEPDRLLYLGDIYGPYAERFDSAYGAAGLSDITLPTAGNHEWPSQRSEYLAYWREQRGRELPAYYSRRLGGWEVLSINTSEPLGRRSPQLGWLRRQLREPGTCRLAFMHVPPFSAGRHGDDADLRPIWEALTGRAALLVAAHDHSMQRLAARQGITTLISGAGGRALYPLDQQDPRLQFGNNTDYGALRLRLRPGVAEYQFRSLDGAELDSGRVRCEQG